MSPTIKTCRADTQSGIGAKIQGPPTKRETDSPVVSRVDLDRLEDEVMPARVQREWIVGTLLGGSSPAEQGSANTRPLHQPYPGLATSGTQNGRTFSNSLGGSNRAPALRFKLTLGQPGDPYEQEADRVADRVMSMPEPRLQRQEGWFRPYSSGIGAQAKGLEEEEVKPHLKCRGMAVRREVETKEEELEQTVQAKGGAGQEPEVDAGLEGAINARKGGGHPLDRATRSFMEPRMGYGFESVRVHADSRAGEMAKALNARAFTVGQDIAFGAGEYQPETSEGRRLMAHELTHVVQQVGGGKSASDTPHNEITLCLGTVFTSNFGALPGTTGEKGDNWGMTSQVQREVKRADDTKGKNLNRPPKYSVYIQTGDDSLVGYEVFPVWTEQNKKLLASDIAREDLGLWLDKHPREHNGFESYGQYSECDSSIHPPVAQGSLFKRTFSICRPVTRWTKYGKTLSCSYVCIYALEQEGEDRVKQAQTAYLIYLHESGKATRTIRCRSKDDAISRLRSLIDSTYSNKKFKLHKEGYESQDGEVGIYIYPMLRLP